MKTFFLTTLLLLGAFLNTSAQSETVTMDTIVVLQEMPEYPGGLPALMKCIGSQLKYPLKARRKGIEGTVRISFFVETNGDVTDVTVIRGISDDCDAEAARVVQHSGKWIPGRVNGIPERMSFVLPINFVLSKERSGKKR